MAHIRSGQPNIALRILPEYGEQSRLEGIYCAGVSKLVVEVAVSSEARDLGEKLRLYERMGVREYIVALTKQEKVLWHPLAPQGFQLVKLSADGVFRSAVFPGLWLDKGALGAIKDSARPAKGSNLNLDAET